MRDAAELAEYRKSLQFKVRASSHALASFQLCLTVLKNSNRSNQLLQGVSKMPQRAPLARTRSTS